MVLRQLTDATFEQFLREHPRVVVDFWAPWCHPCIMLEPRFAAVSATFRGRIAFAKLNTDENPKTMNRFHIRLWPTLVAIKDQIVVDRMENPESKAELTKFVASAFE